MFDRKIILDKHKHGSIWGRGRVSAVKKISVLYADSKFTENIPRHLPHTHTTENTNIPRPQPFSEKLFTCEVTQQYIYRVVLKINVRK